MSEQSVSVDVVKERLTRVAVEDFLRDSMDLEEVARMTADSMYKELFAKVHDEVRRIITGLNVPQEIRTVSERVCMEKIPPILERNVPPMVEGMINAKIGWYKEQIAQLTNDLAQARADQKEESSKRRKVHRAHMALLERVNALEERLKSIEPQETPEEDKKGIFSWGRKKKAPNNQGAECV